MIKKLAIQNFSTYTLNINQFRGMERGKKMCRDNCNKAVNIDVNLKNLSFDEIFGPQEEEEESELLCEETYDHDDYYKRD
ncbi:MAG: hypothetical protein V3T09_08355 [bacterium]